jgi:histidine triad (HIT) family protein
MQVEKSCIFCDIIAGRAESHIIHEDDMTIAILDINPWSKGHALVIPKHHVPWWHQLTDEETSALFKTAKLVSNKIMGAYSPDFVFLYARGRRIPHTHLFLIPTYGGDFLDRMFNALELIQETPQEMARLKDPEAMEEAARLLRSL